MVKGKVAKKNKPQNKSKSDQSIGISETHLHSVLQKQIQKHVEQSISPETSPKLKVKKPKTILKVKKIKDKLPEEKHVSFDNKSNGNKKKGKENLTKKKNKLHVKMKSKEDILKKKPRIKVLGKTKSINAKSARSDAKSEPDLKKRKFKEEDFKTAEELKTKKVKVSHGVKEGSESATSVKEQKYELSKNAKKIHEELRRKDTKGEDRKRLCSELLDLVKGHLHRLIFANDTARVVECLMAHGSSEIKDRLFVELKDHILEMCKSKYAKFFVLKVLKVGSKSQKEEVFKSLQGHIRKLIKHNEAALIIEYAYNEVANANQRSSMLSEFYGAKFAYLKSGDDKSLGEVLSDEPGNRDQILRSMKECLVPLAEKRVLTHSIVHKAMYDYFQHATDKYRKEMVDAVKLSLPHIVHTHDGSRVAMYALWYATNKECNEIVKTFTTLISKVSCEEHGHLVLLAAFDCVRNIKLLKKVVIKELVSSLDSIVENKFGRRVLLYLLSPRDPLVFHPDVVAILRRGDHAAAATADTDSTTAATAPGKHDTRESRLAALRQHVATPILRHIGRHVGRMCTEPALSVFTLTAFTHCRAPGTSDPAPPPPAPAPQDTRLSEALQSAYTGVSGLLSSPYSDDSAAGQQLLVDPAFHLLLKRLVKHDQLQYASSHSLHPQGDQQTVLFSNVLLDTIPAEVVQSWTLCNRGCFTLVILLESDIPQVVEKVRSRIGRKDVTTALKKKPFKGAQVLLKKLQ